MYISATSFAVRSPSGKEAQEKTLNFKVGKRPVTLAAAEAPRQEKQTEFGFQVADLTPQMARKLNLTDDKNIVVAGVKANSKAEKAGIQKGDLIKEVNRQHVESTSDLKKLIHKNNNGDGVDLLVKRMNAGYVVIHMA